MSVWIEAADGAIAFAEDAAALFDERFDLVDELFLIELFFRRAVGFFDMLDGETRVRRMNLSRRQGILCKHTSVIALQIGSIFEMVSWRIPLIFFATSLSSSFFNSSAVG